MRALPFSLHVPVLLFLASRLVLLVGMVWLSPNLTPENFHSAASPPTGWALFDGWDAEWYRKIALHGYEYRPDGKEHAIAFFPLFPMVTGAVMRLFGLDFVPAGVLVNNTAFLIGVIAFHRYVARSYDLRVALWATAALCFYPYSLFGSVPYAEGLLLLTIVLAMSSFQARRYGRAWIFGALATATKITAAPLVPAFFLVAWLEGRGARAFAAALGVGAGLSAFAAYCAYAFGDPLAFVHVQTAWRGEAAGAWKLWAAQLLFGGSGLHKAVQPPFGLLAILGGACLLYAQRARLQRLDLFFGGFALLLVLLSGPMSSARLALVIVPLAIALGLSLSRHPQAGFGVLLLFALSLAGLGAGWALGAWIA